MRKKILLLVFTFLMWTLIFVLQKPVFLSIYGGFSNVFAVIRHGLPLDFSMAGYLSAIPGLLLGQLLTYSYSSQAQGESHPHGYCRRMDSDRGCRCSFIFCRQLSTLWLLGLSTRLNANLLPFSPHRPLPWQALNGGKACLAL